MARKVNPPRQRKCAGCGEHYWYGVACSRCWARLPAAIRNKIIGKVAIDRSVGLIEMAHWFKDHPLWDV